jgi:hypothetical protein
LALVNSADYQQIPLQRSTTFCLGLYEITLWRQVTTAGVTGSFPLAAMETKEHGGILANL